MKHMTICLCLMIFSNHFYGAYAQYPILKKRVELPTKVRYHDIQSVTFGEKGILVAGINSELSGKNEMVTLWYCDKDLNMLKTVDATFAYGIWKYKLVASGEKIFLFTEGYNNKIAIQNGAVPSLQLTNVPIPTEASFNFYVWNILGEKFVGQKWDRNTRYYVESPWKGGAVQLAEITNPKRFSKSIQCEESSNVTMIFFEDYKGNPSHDISFFEKAKQIATLNLDKDHENKIIQCTFTKLPDGSIMLCGSYHRLRSIGCEGFFIANVQDGKLNWIKYHHFTTFKHYFDYWKKGSRASIAARTDAATQTGKDPVLMYSLWLHNLYVVDSKYYLIGEVYYQQSVDMGGAGPTGYAGNKYTHGVIANVDAAGNLIWDQSIYIDLAEKPKEELHVIRPMFLQDRIVLFYPASNTINSKVIGLDGREILPDSMLVIDKGPNGEKWLGARAAANVWYDQHFSVAGTQTTTQGTGKALVTKEVVFVEDISCEN